MSPLIRYSSSVCPNLLLNIWIFSVLAVSPPVSSLCLTFDALPYHLEEWDTVLSFSWSDLYDLHSLHDFTWITLFYMIYCLQPQFVFQNASSHLGEICFYISANSSVHMYNCPHTHTHIHTTTFQLPSWYRNIWVVSIIFKTAFICVIFLYPLISTSEIITCAS